MSGTDHSEKQTFDVEIAGIPLKLRSSNDAETVEQLVHLVDSKIKEALSLSKSVSFQSAIMLSALHIAEDYILLKQKTNNQLESIEDQAKSLLSDLEDSPITNLRLDN